MEQTQTRFSEFVDFVWERKTAVLLLVAGFFFAALSLLAAIGSFIMLHPQQTSAHTHTVAK